MPDGSMFMVFHPNWRDFPEEKQTKLRASVKKKKFTKISRNKASEINTLMQDVASLKRYIIKTNASAQETEE